MDSPLLLPTTVFRALLEIETPLEPLNAALGIDDALLTREERVALSTDLDPKLRLRSPRGIRRAT